MADKFYRLVTYVVDICPDTLRGLFLKHARADTSTTFTTLDAYLAAKKKDIIQLRNRKVIRKDQYELLYPTVGSADENQWDVTLLITLIMELFAAKIQKQEKCFLQEIRTIRNNLHHLPNKSGITDTDYNSYWTRLDNATLYLDRQSNGTSNVKIITDKIQEIKTKHLPNLGMTLTKWFEENQKHLEDIIDELKTDVKEMKANVKETSENVRSVTVTKSGPAGEKVKKINTVDTILRKFKARFENRMKLELRPTFIPPKEIADVRSTLRDKHHVVVSGNCNSRYAETALAAIKDLGYNPSRCVEITETSDWRHIDPVDVDFVLCCDPFGNDCFVEARAKSMADILNCMYQTTKGDSIAARTDVVLVTDFGVLNEFKRRHGDYDILEDVVNVFDVTTEKEPADLTLGQSFNISPRSSSHYETRNLKDIYTRNFLNHYSGMKSQIDENHLRTARETFKKNKAVVLVAPEKYGSVLAVALASSYDPAQCLLLTKPDDILLIDQEVCLVIINQFAGKYRYDENRVINWFENFDHLQIAVEVGKLNIIITCERQPFDQSLKVFEHTFLMEYAVDVPGNCHSDIKTETEENPIQSEKQTAKRKREKSFQNKQTDKVQTNRRSKKRRMVNENNNAIPIKTTLFRNAYPGAIKDVSSKVKKSGKLKKPLQLQNNTPNQRMVKNTSKSEVAVGTHHMMERLKSVRANAAKKTQLRTSIKSTKSAVVKGNGETLIHVAAKKLKPDHLMREISKPGVNVNVRDFAGWTPLHEACYRGRFDNARHLLDAGAYVNAPGLNNNTPLHDAAEHGNKQLVELLLSRGANPEQRNTEGKSPFDLTSSLDIVAIIKAVRPR